MGAKLVKYYELIEDKLGMKGKSELAKLTHKPSVVVAGLPDDPETVRLFQDAIQKLTGQRPA
jgi:hypothetical protein